MSLPVRECRSCGAAIYWAFTQDGERMPLDAVSVDALVPVTAPTLRETACVGAWALNHRRGSCLQVRPEHRGDLSRWAAAGVTFHETHWATCPHAAEHRVHPEQQALEL